MMRCKRITQLVSLHMIRRHLLNQTFQLTTRNDSKIIITPNICNLTISRFYTSEPTYDNTMNVDYNYVKKAIDDKKLIIDVREPQEIIDEGKIPSSVNIPLDKVKDALSNKVSDEQFRNTYNVDKPSTNDEIIFYCKIGKRSGKAQIDAFNLGYSKAKNYLGSMNDWSAKETEK